MTKLCCVVNPDIEVGSAALCVDCYREILDLAPLSYQDRLEWYKLYGKR